MIDYNVIQNALCSFILWGIPILITFGYIMHGLYEWAGYSKVVGIFAPVNESVWEHLKLTFWPILIWWIMGYFLYGAQDFAFIAPWFVSCTVSEIACLLAIITFYYTYTGSLGIKSLILDIFSLFLGVAVGQGSALYMFKHVKLEYCHLYGAVTILTILAALFAIFTFNPPHIPLFKDSPTGKYGIDN